MTHTGRYTAHGAGLAYGAPTSHQYMTFELSWTEIVKCTLKCPWGNKELEVMMRSAETGLAPADLRVAGSLGMAGSSICGAQWLLCQLLHLTPNTNLFNEDVEAGTRILVRLQVWLLVRLAA
jgi:hypothetical protein